MIFLSISTLFAQRCVGYLEKKLKENAVKQVVLGNAGDGRNAYFESNYIFVNILDVYVRSQIYSLTCIWLDNITYLCFFLFLNETT